MQRNKGLSVAIKEALSFYFIALQRFPSIKYNKVQSRVPSVHVCFTATYFWSEKKEEVIPIFFLFFLLESHLSLLPLIFEEDDDMRSFQHQLLSQDKDISTISVFWTELWFHQMNQTE